MPPGDRRALQFGLFLWGAAEGLYIYLLPLQIRHLGGDATAVGLVAAIQALVAGVSMILAGTLADRFGRVPVIRFGAIIAVPGAIVWAIAPHWEWMIVGTVPWAISFASFPAIVGYIGAAHEDHDDHVGAFGSILAFFSLGMIITPAIGGAIAVYAHDIRPVFVLSLVFFVLATVVIWPLTPQDMEPHDPFRVVLRVFLTHGSLLLLSGYLFVLIFAMAMTSSFVGPYLQDRDHASDLVVGLLGSCTSAGEFLIGQRLGRMNDWLGRTRTLVLLQATMALSLVLLLAIHSSILLAPSFVLRGAIATASNMAMTFVGVILPAQQRGAGFGLLSLAVQMGLMASAYTAGLLYAGGIDRPFVVSLALLAATAAVTGPVVARLLRE
ncbi:MAG: major facilitator superfamily 1 [Chloroflexi bacterium]|nr:major facilitator superfamily 1 [Chloroflexota bacterium]